MGNDITRDDLEGEIDAILHPEPDEDGALNLEYPCRRLREEYSLDFSYMNTSFYEGCSMHKYSRLSPPDAINVHTITSNHDVPTSLFYSALSILGDSIIKYYEPPEYPPQLHFYPPVILTAWSGFESFVRYKSELLVATVPTISLDIRRYLQELSPTINSNGSIKETSRYYPVLDRYAILLKYGYNYCVDKSHDFWRRLTKANDLRNHYTHLPIQEPRDLNTNDVLEFLESLFLGIIVPSSHLQRTLLLQIFHFYDMWNSLRELAKSISEQPFLKGWKKRDNYIFHCNFEGIDDDRFPGADDLEQIKRFHKKYHTDQTNKEQA